LGGNINRCNIGYVDVQHVGIICYLMDSKTLLQSRLLTVLLSGVLILVMVIAARLIIQKREVDAEIGKLKAEAEKVEKSNQELSSLIKYLDTPEYAELQAREKLNLKKEGEQVVVLPRETVEPQVLGESSGDPVSNPIKWFNYFFGPRI
jgi:cell division protein FtsB